MVAVIKTGHSILRILNYNENKVKEGVAECIGENNYPVDLDGLTFSMKLNRLQKQLELNTNVTRNSVHISLNFDPSEQDLEKEKLLQIAEYYMNNIGFGEQPYLVYQHHDAGHPHIHIVSIKVRSDGTRIDMQNIGRNQSEKARHEIENLFRLVAADSHSRQETFRLKPLDAKLVKYGRTETKRAITNVLNAVLDKYYYTSLPELNTILKQYNVLADRGTEKSRIFKGGGLVYRVLDEQGKPVGVPIKASDFYNKPTLKFLEQMYPANEVKRQPFKARIKIEIDRLFIKAKPTLSELIKALEKKGIYVALRQNESGVTYGITYVDHETKSVFNGSALGKQYSAKAILERCKIKENIKIEIDNSKFQKTSDNIVSKPPTRLGILNKSEIEVTSNTLMENKGILETLLQPEKTIDYIPSQLKKNSRNKPKKRNIPKP